MTEKKKRGRPPKVVEREPEDLGIEFLLDKTKIEVPKVAGHTMTSREYDSFYLFCEGRKNKEIEAQLGMPDGAVSRFKASPWWRELHERYITEKQKDFHHKMSLRNEEIEEAYFEVLSGADKSDRTAQARMQGVRMYMEAGSDPLINKKPSSLTISNSQIGSGNVKIDADTIKDLTQDEILEMARTGNVPEKVIKEVN